MKTPTKPKIRVSTEDLPVDESTRLPHQVIRRDGIVVVAAIVPAVRSVPSTKWAKP